MQDNSLQLKKIAVLITCHNRKHQTLKCLSTLFQCNKYANSSIDVFIVDDGSTDGTGESIRSLFPDVTVIDGDGSLFWCRGMRMAWVFALETNVFDYFLWLNDDTFLDKNAIVHLLECNAEATKVDKRCAIITGACRSDTNGKNFSYGGHSEFEPIYPKGVIQMCKYINGNVVLIPKEVCSSIGILSKKFNHAMGDFDYGLRAITAGFNCYTTKTFIATCLPTIGEPAWCDPKVPLNKRMKVLYSPKGLNIQEYVVFVRTHKGIFHAISSCIKAHLKMLLPSFYNRLKK